MVLPTTLQCVCLSAAILMVVLWLFIPNLWCTFCVGLSVISIEAGILGFMSLWGVALDSISMVNLIMCIGFSVDFSAHISYHFAKTKSISQSLYAVGVPIIEGALSTVIGVIGLAITPSYVFVTFFKMILLVVTLGALHGIFILPLLLSMMP